MDNRMQGKICVITGGTSGIGKATAAGLAQMGATVVIVGRNQEKGNAVLDEIQDASGNNALAFLLADLSSQASIRQLAAEIQQRYAHLDVLINNAGVFMLRRQTTVDGLEVTFAVNHLAAFLLTNLLLDLLKASAPVRIIHVDSDSHEKATIRMNDLQGEKNYRFWHAYGQSKLAMLLCSYELARRLEGTGVSVNALHPGFVATSMGMNNVGAIGRAVAGAVLPLLGMTPEDGAKTSLYLASSPEVADVSGRYFVKSVPVRSAPLSYDETLQRQMWAASEKLVGLAVAP
ncbi:MAG TPA: SDR family oxidoreductase [Ktedonobacteraceae bacterium]|nr:SDR family oxidoreductase [Ktedonobacteraceae bacterium]